MEREKITINIVVYYVETESTNKFIYTREEAVRCIQEAIKNNFGKDIAELAVEGLLQENNK